MFHKFITHVAFFKKFNSYSILSVSFLTHVSKVVIIALSTHIKRKQNHYCKDYTMSTKMMQNPKFDMKTLHKIFLEQGTRTVASLDYQSAFLVTYLPYSILPLPIEKKPICSEMISVNALFAVKLYLFYYIMLFHNRGKNMPWYNDLKPFVPYHRNSCPLSFHVL